MKKIKKITAIALATVMMFAMSVPAFAADNNTSVDEAVSVNTDNVNRFYERWKSIGNNYAVVTGDDLKNPHGNGILTYEVRQTGYNGFLYQIDCRMYDSYGSKVWEAKDICGVGTSGTLEYGGNVVRIDMRIVPRSWPTPANSYNMYFTY